MTRDFYAPHLIANAERDAKVHTALCKLPSYSYAFEVGRLRAELTKVCDSLKVRENKHLRYTDMRFGEQTYVVGFEYEPAERETRDEPGCDESITVCEVWCRGVDISDILGSERCEELAGDVSEALQDARDAARCDADDARAYGW
jgi:hypothetical protein